MSKPRVVVKSQKKTFSFMKFACSVWHVDIIHYTGGHDRARVQCGMLILFITQVDTIEHVFSVAC